MSDTVIATPTSTRASTTATATTGRPASSYGAAPHDPSKPPAKRQIVCFSFYKVMPEWRRLPAEEKAAHKAAFIEVLNKWNKPGEFLSLTYSTIGTRGDVDMCVWSIGYGVDELNEMRSELMRTPLGGYLSTPHNCLAMTKRSQYQIDRPDESEGEGRGAIRPGGQKYIFIYPFWKTRAWYLLPAEERKRLMDEHIRIGLMYPRVKLNTTYSFGIDDQEFVVAFEKVFREIRLEGHHKLLVVDSEGVSRIQLHPGIHQSNPDMLIHQPLPFLCRQQIPRPGLPERINKDVFLSAWTNRSAPF